eukprot:376311_1
MAVTLFGVTFGLIHIRYGINKFNASATVSEEMCRVVNYTKSDCEYEYDRQMYNDYQYDYVMIASVKCNNRTLHRRRSDPVFDECGVRSYDMVMNVSCYVGECGNNEYSLIGYHDLPLHAKEDIELGCIVLIVTAVPFISFICWVSFCYRCGQGTSN